MPEKDQVSQSGRLVMSFQKPQCYSGWAQSLGASPDLNNIEVGYDNPAPRLIQNVRPRDRVPDREGPALVCLICSVTCFDVFAIASPCVFFFPK
jgi:hypothetical protein